MHEHMMNIQEHVKNTQEHLRIFKHIQGNLNNYYRALILNSHHGNTKNKLGKGLYLHARSIWWRRRKLLVKVLRVEEKKS